MVKQRLDTAKGKLINWEWDKRKKKLPRMQPKETRKWKVKKRSGWSLRSLAYTQADILKEMGKRMGEKQKQLCN